MVLPTRSNAGGDYLIKGSLHQIALRTILVEQSKWYETFVAVMSSNLNSKDSRLITFGPERSIPSFTYPRAQITDSALPILARIVSL